MPAWPYLLLPINNNSLTSITIIIQINNDYNSNQNQINNSNNKMYEIMVINTTSYHHNGE